MTSPTPRERFDDKWVPVTETGCHLWIASRNLDGYGRFHLDGVTHLAHRVSYEWAKGPVPEGLQLDHLCRNRTCVNPNHLEAVTSGENSRRGVRGVRLLGVCKAGLHPVDPDLGHWVGGRCETCRSEKSRERHRAVSKAMEVTGMTYKEYVNAYGRGMKNAQALIQDGA